MKIIFIDIDGVLLPAKAWMLPANVQLQRKPLAARLRAASFDPASVAQLNRLICRTRARLVICSGWRRTLGPIETRDKLVQQGISPTAFHADFATINIRYDAKPDEIDRWLQDHRLTPKPAKPQIFELQWPQDPEEFAARVAQRFAYEQALYDHGVEYVLIDDDLSVSHQCRQIRPDRWDGFGADDYRAALRVLDTDDPEMDAVPITAADWSAIIEKHESVVGWGTNLAAAARWLEHRIVPDGPTRADRLNADLIGAEERLLRCSGYGGPFGQTVAKSRARVLGELSSRRARSQAQDA